MHADSSDPAAADTDPSAAHRLPRDVEPVRYDLRLAPDLQAATFTGDVRIAALARTPVRRITLNAADLVIDHAEVAAGDDAARPAHVALDTAAERITLELDAEAAEGPLTLSLRFTGVLNDRLTGFYRSTFTDDRGAIRVIATTQFEATDARRAFPCFDEPDRKAVFGVTLDVPAGLGAWSNGRSVTETPRPDGGRRVTFSDTIPMSTYLVAFIVGPLEQTPAVDVDGTPLSVVHPPGRAGLTAFALEAGAHALRYFTDWFGIPYPGDKLDLVAIPDFAFGAMENLGCVTFRETALLADPARGSRLELERVADVIAHEIAHMWFGDLVTMRWWNGIWLNEAFATLMATMCTDAFRPEWKRWFSFGGEREAALAVDALHSTRPVEYPVGPPEEAQGMFDVLTYQKGCSVLRMLERYLGGDVFRAGIRQYLDKHRLGNTETSDLWDAIEGASATPVRAVMDTWILQGGHPLVEVQGDGGAAVTLTQRPFMLGPPQATSAIGDLWQVPVMARSVGGGELKTLLGATPVEIDPGGTGPTVVNAGGHGFYRVRYSPELVRRLASDLPSLETLEKFNLLGDTWASVVAGHSDLDDLLVLVEALRDNDDPDVWSQATGSLAFLDHAVPDDDRPALAAYTRALVGPVFDRLGWSSTPGESERTPTLRALALGALVGVGRSAPARQACAERHARFIEGDVGSFDPDLAPAVVAGLVAGGGEEAFGVVLERYRHPDTPQEETRYLMALGGFEHPALAERAYDLAVTEVRTQNAPFLIDRLFANREAGPANWERVERDWDRLLERFPVHIAARMVSSVRLLCRDPALAERIATFLTEHPIPVGRRTVEQTVERQRINVAFAARLAPTSGEVLAAAADRIS